MDPNSLRVVYVDPLGKGEGEVVYHVTASIRHPERPGRHSPVHKSGQSLQPYYPKNPNSKYVNPKQTLNPKPLLGCLYVSAHRTTAIQLKDLAGGANASPWRVASNKCWRSPHSQSSITTASSRAVLTLTMFGWWFCFRTPIYPKL